MGDGERLMRICSQVSEMRCEEKLKRVLEIKGVRTDFDGDGR